MKPLMDKRLTNIIKFDLENLQNENRKTIQGRKKKGEKKNKNL